MICKGLFISDVDFRGSLGACYFFLLPVVAAAGHLISENPHLRDEGKVFKTCESVTLCLPTGISPAVVLLHNGTQDFRVYSILSSRVPGARSGSITTFSRIKRLLKLNVELVAPSPPLYYVQGSLVPAQLYFTKLRVFFFSLGKRCL